MRRRKERKERRKQNRMRGDKVRWREEKGGREERRTQNRGK